MRDRVRGSSSRSSQGDEIQTRRATVRPQCTGDQVRGVLGAHGAVDVAEKLLDEFHRTEAGERRWLRISVTGSVASSSGADRGALPAAVMGDDGECGSAE